MSLVATTILVAPVLIMEFFATRTRLLVIVISSGVFVLAVALLVKAKTVEVLAAGAALVLLTGQYSEDAHSHRYAAVVVSFTNSNTNSRFVPS